MGEDDCLACRWERSGGLPPPPPPLHTCRREPDRAKPPPSPKGKVAVVAEASGERVVIDLDEKKKYVQLLDGSEVELHITTAELALAAEVARLREHGPALDYRQAMTIAFALMEELGTPSVDMCTNCLQDHIPTPAEDFCSACLMEGCLSTWYGTNAEKRLQEGDLADIVLRSLPPPGGDLKNWLDWFEQEVATEGDLVHGRDPRAYLEAMRHHWRMMKEVLHRARGR